MSIIDAILPSLNDILGVRDATGAFVHPVYLVTRTWSGAMPGDGTPSLAQTQMLPTPRIISFSHKAVLTSGGLIQDGDIILESISKATYTARTQIDCTSTDKAVEKLYKIDGFYYQVINVIENLLTWGVTLRKTREMAT